MNPHDIEQFLPVFAAGGVGLLALLGGAYAYFKGEKSLKKTRSEETTKGDIDLPSMSSNDVPTENTQQLVLDKPEALSGRMIRLRSRLANSNSSLGKGILKLLSTKNISETTWEAIEENLLLADMGAAATAKLMDTLQKEVAIRNTHNPQQLQDLLKKALTDIINPHVDRTLHLEGSPAVVLVVGVNGVGKTTTIGKLARLLVAQDTSVMLGAADTFRAAAAEQLTTWGERVGVQTVSSDKERADPASVAFEAVKEGKNQSIDVVLLDTAGRLHNKVGLMDELGKLKRVVEKQTKINEVLLVLDANTGQNGLAQAKVFSEAVKITGIVLTKLDGSAKGGIVVAIQQELKVPVKLIGLGEGPDDLAPFNVQEFVEAIVQ